MGAGATGAAIVTGGGATLSVRANVTGVGAGFISGGGGGGVATAGSGAGGGATIVIAVGVSASGLPLSTMASRMRAGRSTGTKPSVTRASMVGPVPYCQRLGAAGRVGAPWSLMRRTRFSTSVCAQS